MVKWGQEALNERTGSQWQIFVHNREAAIEALQRGECDGIIPAARGFLDGFAGFLHEWGMPLLFDTLPDHRERRNIAVFFLCHTLLYRPLSQLPRLADIGDELSRPSNGIPLRRESSSGDTFFQSPYILRLLGFNARQIDVGLYAYFVDRIGVG